MYASWIRGSYTVLCANLNLKTLQKKALRILKFPLKELHPWDIIEIGITVMK